MSTFPLLHVLILASCKVSEATVVCFIMPFVNQMVTGFGYSPATAAEYAGIIESALVLSEAICAPLWGRLADRYGRRKLLVSGLGAFTVASLGIGLSQSLRMAIVSRCLSGIMGAVSVLVRTVQFEIVDASQLPEMLEILTPCWAIGAAIGPLIGGSLAKPAETMPSLFRGAVWRTYPYLLSAIGAAMLPAASAVACWLWLPETLGRPVAHSHNQLLDPRPDAETEAGDSPRTILQLFKTPDLLYPLLLASLLAFVSMGYCSGFLMFASAPISEGGLDLSPEVLGILLAVSSIIGVLASTKLLPILVAKYGYYGSLRLTAGAHVALFTVIALAQRVADAERGAGYLTYALLAIVLVLYEVGETSYTFLDVAFADRTPKGCLGSVNGVAASAYSVGRMIAPVASGYMWSWSITVKGRIGSSFIWFTYASVALLWWLATLRLHSPVERSQGGVADLGERGQLTGHTIAGYSTFVDSDLVYTNASSSSATLVRTPPTPKHAHLPEFGRKIFTIGSWSEEEEEDGYRPSDDVL